MIIHAHAVPRRTRIASSTPTSFFYTYDQLRPDTWGETDLLMACWRPNVEGMHLGLKWTGAQKRLLQNLSVYKTYEVLPGASRKEYIGVERCGYLLAGGFLPVRLTYRLSDDVKRLVMPGNVGYLYNHLLGLPEPAIAGIAPQLQFINDIDCSNANYSILQEAIPRIIQQGPHLAHDVRHMTEAYNAIHAMSQQLDIFGNARWNSNEKIQDWVMTNAIVEPPVRDLLIYQYPVGPIPLSVFSNDYLNGVIDRTIPEPFDMPSLMMHPSGMVVQFLLSLMATDAQVSFCIRRDVVDTKPLTCFMQNRFGAYLDIYPDEDLALIRQILTTLWANHKPPGISNAVGFLELTCNDEALIWFTSSSQDPVELIFYADLNDITDAWFGVAQTPLPTEFT